MAILMLVNCKGDKQDWEIVYPEFPVFSIYGNVYDNYTKTPIDNVSVSIISSNFTLDSTCTDVSGYFRMDSLLSENVLNMDIRIFMKKDGYQNLNYEISLVKKDIDMNDVYLHRGFILIDEFDTPGDHPSGIAWDGQNIWTCDENSRKIYKHNESMEVIEEFSNIVEKPRAMTFGDSMLWIGNVEDYTLYGFDNDFNLIDSIFVEWRYDPYTIFPTLDLAYKDNNLIACTMHLNYFRIYTPFSHALNFAVIDDEKVKDFSGIVWTGEYFFLRYFGGMYKLDENFIKVTPLIPPKRGLNQLAFDGTCFYGITYGTSDPPKILKFTNIW